MLQLRNITKSYGPLTVLNDISLTFRPGEIMTIVGPSGAGKTTLLQIAGTLDRPDSGEVIFEGKNLIKLKDKKLSKFRNLNLGFIFQFHQLLPEFSALENVALPALIAGKRKKVAFESAKGLLIELGLSNRLGHKPSELSGGEKQRAAIARALINHPSIVLADEPTGSLDSKNRDEIKSIISDLREKYNQSFVIVTHDPEMSQIGDRIVMMEDGKISNEYELVKPSSVIAPELEVSDIDISETNLLPEDEISNSEKETIN